MYVDDFPRHCGSQILSYFWLSNDKAPEIDDYVKTMFGIFVDEKVQKKNYERICKKYKVLYQSPILVNPGSGREYFIVIWLNEKP